MKVIIYQVNQPVGGVGKVAQVIGQSQPQKFCDIMEIEFTSVPDLKKYIQENIKTIIPVLVSYTFDCPNIYYNKSKNTIQIYYIRFTNTFGMNVILNGQENLINGIIHLLLKY